jgi:hypothetical protein
MIFELLILPKPDKTELRKAERRPPDEEVEYQKENPGNSLPYL